MHKVSRTSRSQMSVNCPWQICAEWPPSPSGKLQVAIGCAGSHNQTALKGSHTKFALNSPRTVRVYTENFKCPSIHGHLATACILLELSMHARTIYG